MTLWLLGLNHQTAPVDLRERVAFAGDSAGRALASLRALPDVSEAALLSTCNRTEIYAVARDGDALAGWTATPRAWPPTCTGTTTPTRCATCSGSPPGSIRWCWASHRSWGR